MILIDAEAARSTLGIIVAVKQGGNSRQAQRETMDLIGTYPYEALACMVMVLADVVGATSTDEELAELGMNLATREGLVALIQQ